MEEIIEKIKAFFKTQGSQIMKENPSLKAVFCTGSTANRRIIPESTYQDFDIHLYFDKFLLSKEDLDSVRMIFDQCVKENETDSIAIDYCITDKPWKMIPRKKINIGMHGTLLNRFDYLKRIGPDYILAANMFKCCEILVGELPLPAHEITETDFLMKSGGMGWLSENFNRLLAVLNPAVPACASPIREVAIYFGLTPLIHYFYWKNKKVATRREAREYFEKHSDAPAPVLAAVSTIYHSKELEIVDPSKSEELLKSAYLIIRYVTEQMAHNLSHEYNTRTVILQDEHSGILSEILGHSVTVQRKICCFEDTDYNSALSSIKNELAIVSDYTPDEFVETVQQLADGSRLSATRLYFFGYDSLRPLDETDFGCLCRDNFLFGWEKSISTYIQRLNEHYLKYPQVHQSDLLLAKSLTACAKETYAILSKQNRNLPEQESSPQSNNLEEEYFSCLRELALMGENVLNADNAKV